MYYTLHWNKCVWSYDDHMHTITLLHMVADAWTRGSWPCKNLFSCRHICGWCSGTLRVLAGQFRASRKLSFQQLSTWEWSRPSIYQHCGNLLVALCGPGSSTRNSGAWLLYQVIQTPDPLVRSLLNHVEPYGLPRYLWGWALRFLWQ